MNNINLYFPLDYIILIIILLFVIFSTWKGFIQSVLGLMTWVGSIIITLYSYVSLSDYINKQLYKYYESIGYSPLKAGSDFMSKTIIKNTPTRI